MTTRQQDEAEAEGDEAPTGSGEEQAPTVSEARRQLEEDELLPPRAALARYLSRMRQAKKISVEQALTLIDYFIATSGVTQIHDFFAGLHREDKDAVILAELPVAEQWKKERQALLSAERSSLLMQGSCL